MKKMICALAVLWLLAAPRAALAVDCNSDALTTADMRECVHAEYDLADKELNAAYKKAMAAVKASATPEFKDKLVAAQRAWIEFRDKDCAFDAALFEGGTMYGILYTACLTDRTNTRTRELLGYADAWTM